MGVCIVEEGEGKSGRLGYSWCLKQLIEWDLDDTAGERERQGKPPDREETAFSHELLEPVDSGGR